LHQIASDVLSGFGARARELLFPFQAESVLKLNNSSIAAIPFLVRARRREESKREMQHWGTHPAA
jgi:hypothetical protein